MAVKLVVEGLVKRFGRFTLRVDKLVLNSGIHVIIGPNGSGKTTLLKILAGLLRPDKGRVTYEINNLTVDSYGVLKYASIVTTDMSLPNVWVADLLSIFLKTGQDSIKSIAREFNLESILDKRYDELSSGYKKRVQIAIALGKDTPILMLDEPFVNVDSRFISILEDKLLAMPSDRLILVVSHVPSRLLNKNIIYISDGRIAYSGRVKRVLEKLVDVAVEENNKVQWIGLDRVLSMTSLKVVGVRVNSIHELLEKVTSTRQTPMEA